MKKIFALLLLLFFLGEAVSAQLPPSSTCIPAEQVKCAISDIGVQTNQYSDEVDITVKFKNVGTEKCKYQMGVIPTGGASAGKTIEKEPDINWLDVKPNEFGAITLSSNWDPGWDVCDLPGAIPGTAEFQIEYSSKYPGGPECTTVIATVYTFDAPQFCCGPYEGMTCLNYSGGYGGFTCDASVQINFNVSCLAYCSFEKGGWFKDWSLYKGDECTCVLEDACAIECIQGEPSFCLFDYFVCAGPNYRCPSVAQPEVMCSTTKDCKFKCAAECGRESNCVRDCDRCCRQTTCNKILPSPYEDYELEVCMDSCMGLCETHVQLCNIIYILGGVSVGAAIIMTMFHGIKWTTSDDFEGRDDARRGIAYTFVGLILVLVATALASYLFTGDFVC